MTPTHYTHTKKEPIKVINSINLGFNLGSAYKYLARAGYKGSKKKDIKKAIDYIGFEIEQQTFFCDDSKLQIIDQIRREVGFDEDLVQSLLLAIKNTYIHKEFGYLLGLNLYLENLINLETNLEEIVKNDKEASN